MRRAPFVARAAFFSPAGQGGRAFCLAPSALLRQQAASGTAGSEAPQGLKSDDGGATTQNYDPYAVLGLKPGASTNDVRLRYHELMRETHPTLSKNGGDPIRLAQINKAYNLVTKSPTLDRRFRNLISETQFHYYKWLPEWMARNVDEMPRYWSWYKWRITSVWLSAFLLGSFSYIIGGFFVKWPVATTVMILAFVLDVLLHTQMAPACLSLLFLKACATPAAYDLSWLMSMKHQLQRDLSY